MNNINKAIYVIASFLLISCNRQSFQAISKRIDTIYRKGKATNKETFHEVRVKALRKAKPLFLKPLIDSLFILEEYSMEDVTWYGRMWNSKGSIEYKYLYKKMHFVDKSRFTKFMRESVQKWDTATIRKEEKLYGDSNPSFEIYATRIINDSGHHRIDTITFKSFFKVERDRSN